MVHLATVATSPIVGPVVSRLGLRRVFTLGVVCLSVASIGFGLLDFINQTISFLILAYILRLVLTAILFLSSSYNNMQYKSLPQVAGGDIWSPAVACNVVTITCKVKQKT